MYTNSIPICNRETELVVKKLPTLRKEIIFKHDRKVGLLVISVQYSTYTKTIVRIPTVYQLMITRQKLQSKKLPDLRKEIIFKHDRKVRLVVKSIQYSTYTKTIVHIPTVYQLVTARQNSQSKKTN